MDKATEARWFDTCYCCLHTGMQKKDTPCCSYCDDLEFDDWDDDER